MATKRVLAVIEAKDRATPVLKGISSSLKLLGGVAAAVGTYAIGRQLVNGMSAAVRAATEFESSFVGVRKTVDATEAELLSLSKALRALASGPNAIPIDVNELNQIASAAGQLGVQTKNIVGFTEVMAKLGVATNLTSDEAATSLARLANITGLAQDEFSNLGSTIVDLGNNFATTEAEIVAMGLRLAGAGDQIGLSTGEILAFATALTSVGIEAEAGGTAFSTVFADIAKAVGNGSKKLDKFARIAGMSAAEFAAVFRTDAAGAIRIFIEGLGRASDAGEEMFGVLESIGFGQKRVRDSLLRSASASDQMGDALDRQGKAWEENIALDKEADAAFATLANTTKLFKQSMYDLGITVGESVTPVMQTFLKQIATPLVQDLTSAAGKANELQLAMLDLGIAFASVGLGVSEFLADVQRFAGIEIDITLPNTGGVEELARVNALYEQFGINLKDVGVIQTEAGVRFLRTVSDLTAARDALEKSMAGAAVSGGDRFMAFGLDEATVKLILEGSKNIEDFKVRLVNLVGVTEAEAEEVAALTASVGGLGVALDEAGAIAVTAGESFKKIKLPDDFFDISGGTLKRDTPDMNAEIEATTASILRRIELETQFLDDLDVLRATRGMTSAEARAVREITAEEESYARLMAAAERVNADTYALTEAHQSRMDDLEQKHSNARKRIAESEAKTKQQQAFQTASVAASAIGQMFGDSKAGAYATAIVQTAQSVATALSTPPGVPWTIPQGVLAAALGAVQIATIAGTNIQGRQAGGMIGGMDRGRDTVPAMLQPGELVIPTRSTPGLLRDVAHGVISDATARAIGALPGVALATGGIVPRTGAGRLDRGDAVVSAKATEELLELVARAFGKSDEADNGVARRLLADTLVIGKDVEALPVLKRPDLYGRRSRSGSGIGLAGAVAFSSAGSGAFGFARGGIVPGKALGFDSITANLDPGDVVLSPSVTQRFVEQMGRPADLRSGSRTVALSAGEFILDAEMAHDIRGSFTRAGGTAGMRGRRNIPGFARGGVVPAAANVSRAIETASAQPARVVIEQHFHGGLDALIEEQNTRVTGGSLDVIASRIRSTGNRR